jgi:hypothetical protein
MNEMQTDIGDIIEPTSVEFSFDAPGWYAVGAALVLVMLIVFYLLWRNYRRNKYRRTALQYLSDLEKKFTGNQLTYETNMVMKRIALRSIAREQVASLRNEEWINFLNASGKAGLFPDETKKVLNQIYTTENIPSPSFVQSARTWIKIHNFRNTKLKAT